VGECKPLLLFNWSDGTTARHNGASVIHHQNTRQYKPSITVLLLCSFNYYWQYTSSAARFYHMVGFDFRRLRM